MNILKRYTFVGGRIVKTGIAVFVTAFICHLLDWPAMFAVITAIVTVEPTVADSIRKAFIRFPASAIGAGFAVLFTFLFGDSPYTYAFVSLATIIFCHKLKLHDGTLVATLTGVAMISTVTDHYLASFFVRLGTTSTGLIVSTLVNFLVMPPNYSGTITAGINLLYKKAGDILSKRGKELTQNTNYEQDLRTAFQNLVKEIERMETLCHYQKKEWKYHRFNREQARNFHYEYKKLTVLRQISYHIGHLIYLPSTHFKLEIGKTKLILSTIEAINTIFHDPNCKLQEEDEKKSNKITEWFIQQKENQNNDDEQHHISYETVILYELLSIYDLIAELSQIQSMENNHH